MKTEEVIDRLIYDDRIKAFSNQEQTALLDSFRLGERSKQRLLGSLAKEQIKKECELEMDKLQKKIFVEIDKLQKEINELKKKINCEHELVIDSQHFFICSCCYSRVAARYIVDGLDDRIGP